VTDTDTTPAEVEAPADDPVADHIILTSQILSAEPFTVQTGDGHTVTVPEPLWSVFVNDVRQLARDVKLMSNLSSWAGALMENGASMTDVVPAWAVERYNRLCSLMHGYMRPDWANEASSFIASADEDETLAAFAVKASQSVAWIESLAETTMLLANQRQQAITFPIMFWQSFRSASATRGGPGMMLTQLGSGTNEDTAPKTGQYL
jgi:hypothetical protein